MIGDNWNPIFLGETWTIHPTTAQPSGRSFSLWGHPWGCFCTRPTASRTVPSVCREGVSATNCRWWRISGWWWLEPWNFMTFHFLGRVTPTDFHIFQRGSNHQPDLKPYKSWDIPPNTTNWCRNSSLYGALRMKNWGVELGAKQKECFFLARKPVGNHKKLPS